MLTLDGGTTPNGKEMSRAQNISMKKRLKCHQKWWQKYTCTDNHDLSRSTDTSKKYRSTKVLIQLEEKEKVQNLQCVNTKVESKSDILLSIMMATF